MNKFISITMYVLWTAAIISVLTTTFTNFQYVDLNFIAMFLLIVASLNSFLIVSMTQKIKEKEEKNNE